MHIPAIQKLDRMQDILLGPLVFVTPLVNMILNELLNHVNSFFHPAGISVQIGEILLFGLISSVHAS